MYPKVPVPLKQVYQANEEMARMYKWYEKVGTGIDISALHQEYPEGGWLTSRDWSSISMNFAQKLTNQKKQ